MTKPQSLQGEGSDKKDHAKFGLALPRVPVKPTLVASVLFFLIFSGPPSLRLRDVDASLEALIDPSVIVQVTAWILAGGWALTQAVKDLRRFRGDVLRLPDRLGIAMIVILSASILISPAPALTAFKIGQMFVSLAFTWVFVNRYGIAKCLDYIFYGSTALCLAIGIAAFVDPDLVIFAAEDGGMRLRGDPIAVCGIVVTYAIILLILRRRRTSWFLFWSLLAILLTLMGFSLTRQAWLLVGAFLVLYAAKHVRTGFLKNLVYAALIAFPFFFVFYVLPRLDQFRPAETIGTLTGRTDLWIYLIGLTLLRSPWIGLGYYSASRVYGPDFNPGMGTAHSMFVEVFLGGGILALIPLLIICFILVRKALPLALKGRGEVAVASGVLFFVTLALGALGGDIAYGQVGITFWALAAAVPGMPALSPGWSKKSLSPKSSPGIGSVPLSGYPAAQHNA